MTANSISSISARPDTRLLDDNDVFVAAGSLDDARGDGPAAGSAGSSSGSGLSAGALGGVSLHKAVRTLAHNAEAPATPGSGKGAALYSGKESAAAGPAVPSTRRDFEQSIERMVDVFAKAGKLDLLAPWLTNDPAKRVHFELKPGRESAYDPARRTMVLGADSTPGEQAQAIVLALRKEHYERADHHQPASRDEYVRQHNQAVANAAADAVEFTQRARAGGVEVPVTTLEKVYDIAYQGAFNDHIHRQVDELTRRTGRYADGVFNPELAKDYAAEHARQTVRWALAEAVAGGRLREPASQQTYPAVFGREWDAKQAAENACKSQELARTQAAAQADSDRRATIEAGRKVLTEAVRVAAEEQAAGNRASPHKAQVVELLFAFRVKYPGEMALLLADISPAVSQLLGPYGFKNWDEIGAQGAGSGRMEFERLDYAMENFRRMTEQQRKQLEHGINPASEFGIALTLTSSELKARDGFEISERLPDGTHFRGTRAEYREASRRNINNHALAQIAQIRSASAMSLVGRLFAGEKGAQVGAMFDSLVNVGTAQQARVQVRSGVANPSDIDYRTPIDNGLRRTAPPAAPAGEGRPVPQATGHAPTQPGIAMAPTQPGIAMAPTQPAAAGGNGGSNGSGSSNPGAPRSGSGSTGSNSGSPGTTGPGTADSRSGPRTANTTGAGSASTAADTNGRGLPQSTYYTDPRRVTVVTAARGEQIMTLGDYRTRVEQARQWISRQGPYDLGGPPRPMYDRAAEIFTLDRNWQYLGNRLLSDW